MTLVNKIIQVSGAQLYNTSSVHCVVCSPPQVRLLSITIYLPYTLLHLLHPHFPPPILTLLFVSMSFCFFPQSFLCLHFYPYRLHPPSLIIPFFSLSMSLSLFCLVVHLFLRFHIWVRSCGNLSFSDWLISLSIMLSRSVHAVVKGKISYFYFYSSIPFLSSIPLS